MPDSLDKLVSTAVGRFHELFDTHDRVIVSCSGGKDSTSIVECGAIAARERGIKLEVWFFDEELIPTETVEYMYRMEARPDIDLKWMCLPIKEGNAFSKEHPYWYPWDPRYRDVWMRNPPPFGSLDYPPGFRPGVDIADNVHYMAAADIPKTTVQVIGRRAAESPARRSMNAQFGWHYPITRTRSAAVASPIIEWGNFEVWEVLRNRGWDWNRHYLSMYRAGIKRNQLRIGPMFGEEPSITAHAIRWHSPDVWRAAEKRIPGVANIARYAKTAVMGRGRMRADTKVTRETFIDAMRRIPPTKRLATRKSFRDYLKQGAGYRQPANAKNALKIALRGDSKASRLCFSSSMELLIAAKKKGKYVFNHGSAAERRRKERRVEGLEVAKQQQDKMK